MTSIVLECSKYNDINTGNTVNSNWDNKFSSIILEEGDEVSVKQVFIDTTNGNSSNIVLAEDVVIEAYFWYYRQNQNTANTTFEPEEWYATFLPCIAMDSADPLALINGYHTFTIPKGTYSPQGIAEFISTQFTLVTPPIGSASPLRSISNQFMKATDATGTAVRFHDFDLTTGVIDTDKYFFPNQAEWFGASQVALSYNSDQNGIFQFDYLHTPFYNTGDESIGMFKIDEEDHPHDGEFIGVTRAGGIIFRDLQPRSFWEGELGFDVDSMTVTNTDYKINFPTGKTFNDMVTNAVFSLDDVFDNAGGNPNKCPDTEFFKKSTATISIKAPLLIPL